jgi:hypothetical protein
MTHVATTKRRKPRVRFALTGLGWLWATEAGS